MVKIVSILLALVFVCSTGNCENPTYVKNGTTYYVDSVYSSTGLPVVKRSATAKKEFLKQQGLTKAPTGYEIDHITPLYQGGADTPDNMQLLSKEEHRKKTVKERKELKNSNKDEDH